LPTRTVREDVVRAHVNLLDSRPAGAEPRDHLLVDPPELPLRDQLPTHRILVRHDRDAVPRPGQVRDRAHGPVEELEMLGGPDVSGPPAVDHAVPIEEPRGAPRAGLSARISSSTSRSTAASGGSPKSRNPPGRFQYPCENPRFAFTIRTSWPRTIAASATRRGIVMYTAFFTRSSTSEREKRSS